MIHITPNLTIDESKIDWQFVRAQGPGGQNVNKVSSAAQLRFNTYSLPPDVLMRLQKIAGKKITQEGELIITAQRFRSQEQNRQDALNKLIALLQQASIKPKKRRKTKPTKASVQRRLEKKQRQSKIKKMRGKFLD